MKDFFLVFYSVPGLGVGNAVADEDVPGVAAVDAVPGDDAAVVDVDVDPVYANTLIFEH